MKNEICPAIEGIGGMTDLEAFACFTVDINEQGSDLWEFRKVPQKRSAARELAMDMVPAEADLMVDKVGRAGSLERVEAVVRQYQNSEE